MFIVSNQDFLAYFENSYPSNCFFGHVLDRSNSLENLDSSKGISKPTYTETCNPLKKPRSVGPTVSKQSIKRKSNKKLNQGKNQE